MTRGASSPNAGDLCVTPHVAAKVRHSAIDRRTTRHAAYATSQRKRKVIEEAFGWAKTIAGIAKVKVRGLARVRHCFTLAITAYNHPHAQAARMGRRVTHRPQRRPDHMASPIEPITRPRNTGTLACISAACN